MSLTLTAKQISDLDRSMVASQRMPYGGLGSYLNAAFNGSGAIAVVHLQETAPAIGTATATHAAIALTSSTQTVSTGFTQPDFPRCLSIKGNASGNAGNVVIHGTNYNDEVISDTIALNGSTEVLGVKAFKTITSVDLPAETHAGTDTVSIGRSDRIGLYYSVTNAAYLLNHLFGGSADSGTFVPAATVEGTYYTPAGTLDSTTLLTLVYIAA